MDENEIRYLTKKWPQLLELVMWNASFAAYLAQDGVMTRVEMADLNDIQITSRRLETLVDILKRKINGYSTLLHALKSSGQSGAVLILEAIPKRLANNSENTGHIVTEPNQSKYRLDFGPGVNVEHQVLTALQHQLINAMPNADANLEIISELGSLGIFDYVEIEPVQNGQYRTEKQRMTAMFGLIRQTGESGIIKCLEKLCDLENLQNHSEKIRNIITKRYPESLKIHELN